MQFAGIFHKTSEQMSYALNENELIVNLRTGYDVRRVFIHYGDPFESGILGGNEKWTGKREEICFKKRLRHQLWWTTTLVPKYKRCKYYFELHTEEEVWYYFEDAEIRCVSSWDLIIRSASCLASSRIFWLFSPASFTITSAAASVSRIALIVSSTIDSSPPSFTSPLQCNYSMHCA